MNYPKPDVDPIAVLRRFYCNRILPQVYDDSLSFEELLYGVLKKMNEVIEKVNSYDELINYVIDLLENLDKHIKETVTEQLQKWYDDGTLKEILAVICDPYFDEFRKEIAQLKKDFVTFKNQPHSTYIDFERWLLGYTYRGENLANADQETARYPVNQGGARYTIGGNIYYACAFVPRGHTLELHPTTAAVVIFNYSNGAQVARRDIEGLGHANSIVYNSKRNSLFVAVSELNGSPSKTIFELNPTTLATIQKYSPPAGYNESAVSSVAYDQTNDQMYISQGLNVYEWDPATNTASNMVSLSNPGFDYIMQVVKANATAFVMLTYSPNTIRIYDKSGVYIRQFTIPQYLDNQRFWSGEFEDITVNDKFYVYANSQGITAVNPTDSMISIWRGSLLQGTPSSIKQSTTQGYGAGYSTINNLIYVNNNVDNGGTYHMNRSPDGTKDNPFIQIFQAMDLLACPIYHQEAEIHVKSGSNSYRWFNIANGGNVYITGRYDSKDPPATMPRLMGLVMHNCNSVTLDNLNIANSNTNEANIPHTIRAVNVNKLLCNDVELIYSSGKTAYNMLNTTLVLSGAGSGALKEWPITPCIRLQRGSQLYGYEKHNIGVNLESDNTLICQRKICDAQNRTSGTIDTRSDGGVQIWSAEMISGMVQHSSRIGVRYHSSASGVERIQYFYGFKSGSAFTMLVTEGSNTIKVAFDGIRIFTVSDANGLVVDGIVFEG